MPRALTPHSDSCLRTNHPITLFRSIFAKLNMNEVNPTKSARRQSWLARMKRRRSSRWSLRILYALVFIALFGDFLANEKPIWCKIDGQHFFPILKSYAVELGLSGWDSRFLNAQWKDLPYEAVLFPPVPYSATGLDLRNSNFRSPFSSQQVSSWRWRHWLGTDRLGRDVLAGLIAGTRVALLVGLIAMGVAVVLGIFMGALAGYFADDKVHVRNGQALALVPALALAVFYAFVAPPASWSLGLRLVVFAAILYIFFSFGKLIPGRWASKQLVVPLDMLVMRTIEVFDSIPTLLLLLAVVAILESSSVFYVMLVIGLVRWTGIARFLRAELLKVKKLNYIEAARAMGFSEGRILFRHALPNALGPVIISTAFGIASAILLESALSFLGIGVGSDSITWGAMLSAARQAPSAWWLALFPGLAIFVTVTAFNLLGEAFAESM